MSLSEEPSSIYDIIIVGSGPSGVWGAWGLENKNVLMLDIGEISFLDNPLDLKISDIKRHPEDFIDVLLGKDFESLNNIFKPYLSPKVKAPGLKPLIKTQATQGFDYISSEAQGGLANNWGAGVYPFNDFDLKSFPIEYNDLKDCYIELSEEIGISGANDDLVELYGNDIKLQKPVHLPEVLTVLLSNYSKSKKDLNKDNVYLGYGRMAISTEGSKTAVPYNNAFLEYFCPNNPSVYNPRRTLKSLKSRTNFKYQSGLNVESFHELNGIVEVTANEIQSGAKKIFRCRKLLLAAGAIQSTSILARSKGILNHKFPLLDNCASLVPMYCPKLFGTSFNEGQNVGGILNGYFDYDENYIHFSIYSIGQILLSDLLTKIPLSIDQNRELGKILFNSLAVLQIFYPDKPKERNYIQYKENGTLEISYNDLPFSSKIEKKILSNFRKLGFLCTSLQIEHLKAGNGIHYAGMVPMTEENKEWTCDRNCKIRGTENIYILDAASFPTLPAKNHTFTIMANALRVGKILNTQDFQTC